MRYIACMPVVLIITFQNTIEEYLARVHNIVRIYIIIRHCPGVGAFPRPFCVPNSVALASLTLQVGDWAIH